MNLLVASLGEIFTWDTHITREVSNANNLLRSTLRLEIKQDCVNKMFITAEKFNKSTEKARRVLFAFQINRFMVRLVDVSDVSESGWQEYYIFRRDIENMYVFYAVVGRSVLWLFHS